MVPVPLAAVPLLASLALLLPQCRGLSPGVSGAPVPLLDLAPAFGETLHGFTLGVPAVRATGDLLEGARYEPARGGGAGTPLVIDPGGRFTSAPLAWPEPFDELLMSWNVVVPEGGGFHVEVAVGEGEGDGETWSPWLYLGDWGVGLAAEERTVAFDGGRVAVDVLRCTRPFQRFRYRITAGGAQPVEVWRSALCLTDTGRLAHLNPGAPSLRGARLSLDVPPRSQRQEEAALAPRICSPTSVTMVLASHGIERPTAEVAALLYDADHDLYGNWPRAVQGAFALGVEGTLVRLSSWTAVEHFLSRGIPLVVSVRVAEGELRGAPYPSTDGHLLVITGFDGSGGVRVNDPAAARPAEVPRVYRREDLERVWMAKGGVAYAIGPGRSLRQLPGMGVETRREQWPPGLPGGWNTLESPPGR